MSKSKPKLNFALLCDEAIIEDNKPTIKGVFSTIIAKKIPANQPKMSLVAEFFMGDNKNHSLLIEILSPEGKKTTVFSDTVASGTDNYIFGQIVNFNNFPFLEFGDYTIRTEVDNKNTGEVFFNLIEEKKKNNGN